MRTFSKLLVQPQRLSSVSLTHPVGDRIHSLRLARSLSLSPASGGAVLLYSQRFKSSSTAAVEEKRDTGSKEETTAPVDGEHTNGTNGATNSQPTNIFEQMTTEELLRGSQQAYYALGGFLNELSMGISGSPTSTTTTPAAISVTPTNPLVRLQAALNALQRAYPDVPRPSSSEVVEQRERESNPASWPRVTSNTKKPAPEPVSPAERVKDEASRFVKYLRRLFPLTQDMAEKVSAVVCDEDSSESYLLQISGPQDYIVQSQVLCGGVVQDHQVTEDFSELTERPFSTEDLKRGETSTPLLKSNGRRGEGESSPLSSSSNETGAKAGILFSFEKEMKAKAYVMVRHAVVVPPQRRALSFDWFYRRIAPGKSENERILAAKHFAVLSDSNILSVVDFIARMFTGAPMLIKLIPQLKKSLKLPEHDIHTAVPVVHKDVVMVLTEQEKWLIHVVGTEESLAIINGPTL